MPVITELLKDKEQTGKRMHQMIERFHSDLMQIKEPGKRTPIGAYTLQNFFSFVALTPYRRDKKYSEVVARPKILLGQEFKSGIDCKKKAVVVSSWLKLHSIPYRLIACSTRKDKRIHHVFPQAKINGEWKNLDATYRHYRPYQSKRVTAWEVLPK
jgi:hypothetical protein